MKKTVQIVTIPLDKEGWNEGDITLCVDAVMSGTNSIGTITIATYSYRIDNPYWQAQQLLVLSDDEIQEGDICHDYCDAGQPPYKHLIGKCLSVDKTNGWIEFKDYKTGLGWCKKIIASYPHIEGTLPISKETVQAWIDAGTPGEGSVENHPYLIRNGDNTVFDDFNVDTQGNLLLEFGEKIINTLPYPELMKGISEYYKDVKIVEEKPSIPTDEEIEEKAASFIHDYHGHIDKDLEKLTIDCLGVYYINGYKQALKDLGHE